MIDAALVAGLSHGCIYLTILRFKCWREATVLMEGAAFSFFCSWKFLEFSISKAARCCLLLQCQFLSVVIECVG